MTNEEAIKYLRQIYPNGGHCWLDSQRIEAIEMAISALSQPSLPSNLDEVTMDFARELDFFLYGSYTPERFPNSMQVRDEHSGLKVNDWKCWVNRPELRIEKVKHFFTIGKQAGAEWMAGQFQKIEGELVDWYSTSEGKDYCCGIKTSDSFVVPEGFYIRKKQ